MSFAGVMPIGRLPQQPSVATAQSFPKLPLRQHLHQNQHQHLHQRQRPLRRLHPLLRQCPHLHHPQPPK